MKASERPIFDQIRSMIQDRPTMEQIGSSDGTWCVEREFNTPLCCRAGRRRGALQKEPVATTNSSLHTNLTTARYERYQTRPEG